MRTAPPVHTNRITHPVILVTRSKLQSGTRPVRQQQRSSASLAVAKASLAVGALNTPTQVQQRWEALLEREQQLRAAEARMCVVNIRWSHAFWADLHDKSQQLCRDMAACIEQMEGLR